MRGQKRALLGSKNLIRIYAGQYYDQETGLHYNWNRYYDPSLGRYLRPDPLSEDPNYFMLSTVRMVNRYDYVLNNPLKSTDPKGLSPVLEGGGFGAEGQFIYGYGRDTFFCCDGCDLWRVRTSKHCLGAGFVLSGGGTGQFTGASGKNTCPDGYGGIAIEFGAGPGEYGISIGSCGITNSLGIGGGIGAKATVCYYRVIEKKKIGKCSK